MFCLFISIASSILFNNSPTSPLNVVWVLSSSAPGASPALKKKVKKKTVKSAGVGMFIDSDDDDFELANMDIPKSKTLVHDLT